MNLQTDIQYKCIYYKYNNPCSAAGDNRSNSISGGSHTFEFFVFYKLYCNSKKCISKYLCIEISYSSLGFLSVKFFPKLFVLIYLLSLQYKHTPMPVSLPEPFNT